MYVACSPFFYILRDEIRIVSINAFPIFSNTTSLKSSIQYITILFEYHINFAAQFQN